MHRFTLLALILLLSLCFVACVVGHPPPWHDLPDDQIPPRSRSRTSLIESPSEGLTRISARDQRLPVDSWVGKESLLVLPGAFPTHVDVAVMSAVVSEYLELISKRTLKVEVFAESPERAEAMAEIEAKGISAHSLAGALAIGRKLKMRFVYWLEISRFDYEVIELQAPYATSIQGPPGSWRVRGEIAGSATIVDTRSGEVVFRREGAFIIDDTFHEKPDPISETGTISRAISWIMELEDHFKPLFHCGARVKEVRESGKFLRISVPDGRRVMDDTYGMQVQSRALVINEKSDQRWYELENLGYFKIEKILESGDLWVRCEYEVKPIEVGDWVSISASAFKSRN